MTTQRITPQAGCRWCKGRGIVYQSHPWGSTTATEELFCECVLDQIEDDDADIIIEQEDWGDDAYDSWKEREI